MKNPLGIDCEKPRLSWKLYVDGSQFHSAEARDKFQSAYHILVASSETLLTESSADMWNSGKVRTDKSIHVSYKGKPMESRHRYFWKVKVWDEHNEESEWSESAYWVMGILSEEEWDKHSKWIGLYENLSYADRFPISEELKEVHQSFRAVAREMHPKGDGPENDYAAGYYLRKDFRLSQDPKQISSALIRISGLGYYELRLNGQKVGNTALDPGATDYTKHVLYSTYEIKKENLEDLNCLGVLLGTGWYFAGVPDLFGFECAPWVAPPKCIAELEIIYNDGNTDYIGTDETWMITDKGPLRFNSVRSGEIYDSRISFKGWDLPHPNDFDTSNWKNSLNVDAPKGF